MHYTIYKITNILDGKYYIGKHQTKDLDDGYMGSGKLLKRAIQKHGINNFSKEILHVFQTEHEMNDKEKELVTLNEMSYNLCPGGDGGFGYINTNLVNVRDKREYKVLGAHAANKKGANIKGSKKHAMLLKTDPEYRSLWKSKLTINKDKHDCPFCAMKNLNSGNLSRHIKSKHS